VNKNAEKTAMLVMLAVSFVLFCIYSFVTPLFEASDELWHYPMVQHLATTASLPIQQAGQTDAEAPWRQEGSQPPLYYAIAALATAPIDTSNWRDLRQVNPHSDMGNPTRDGNANVVLHTPAEQFPWTRAALAVHIARLVSVLFSTLTVLFTYLVASEMFPRRTDASGDRDQLAWVRLGSMAFVAGVPMFAFISGSVNNDNAAAMFSTLGLWWAIRLVRRNDLSTRTALIAGLIGAAAALSKSSTLGLLGVFFLAAFFVAISTRVPVRVTLRRTVIFMLVIVVVTLGLAGWWFVRNQLNYGDLLGWNAFFDAVGKRDTPATLQQLWSEREGFVWAFWGVFGGLNVIMPNMVYTVLNCITLLALLGLIWKTSLRRVAQAATPTEGATPYRLLRLANAQAPALLCAVWLIITFIAFLRWTSLTPASQGRLLFPCIAVIAMSLSYGLYQWHRALLGASAVGLLGLAFAVPFAIIAPAYAQPPDLAVATPAHRLDVTFGDTLDLLGYDTPPASAQPGDEVTLQLYWHLRAPAAKDYSIFVHLLSADDVIIAQRDMYPGQGTLATSQLHAGYTWQDHYTVRIPNLALAGQPLRWAVGVYDLQTGQRLTSTHGIETDQGVVFGRTELTPSAGQTALLDYGNGIVMQRYEVTPTELHAGQPLSVTLHWLATRPIDTDYTVSLQLIDEQANKIAQNDSAPVQGNAPSSSWAANTPITDTHVLDVSGDAAPGVYRLLLVWYLPTDFSRLGAYDARGLYVGTEVELTRLRVK
jgi:hypothetical protein